MTYSSASQIIEQIARVAVGIALAVVLTRKLGVVYGAAGATFGAVAGAIVALVYMYVSFFMFRKKQADFLSQQVEETDENNKVVMKTLIMLAIPVAIGGIVNTVMGLINSVTLTSLLQGIGYTETAATELLGVLEQKAQTLVSIPMVAGTALSASLVPSISESIMKKEKALISLKTSWRFVWDFNLPAQCDWAQRAFGTDYGTCVFGRQRGIRTDDFTCVCCDF